MKTFYQYALVVAVSLLGLFACSSDDDAVGKTTEKAPIAQPQVTVRDLTTSGFTLRWEAVAGASSYVYTFNDGAQTTIADCQIAFSGLERQKEYVVAIKACPKGDSEYTESSYTYIHVLTDNLEQLPMPKVILGCAYASKTIITWSEVPETSLYEFTIDDQSYTTAERMVTLTTLAKGHSYAFTVRAMTGDATRYDNSEPAELPFTTSNDDIPTLLVVPTTIISDAVAFDVFATSDQTYYYDVIPAATFAKYTSDEIMTAYQKFIIEYAAEKGISLQLAMASMLKSGTKSLKITGLTPELSYVAFAFGMDLKGQITTGISSTKFKTTSDGYSDGPNFGGSDWFKQSFYITNAYAGLTGYGWTNSVWTFWQGEDVTTIRYRTLSTTLFNKAFPDISNKQSIIAFLKDDEYSYPLDPALLSTVNSTNGYSSVTPANSGTSYTLSTLATSSSGEETLCVNSVTTKTSTAASTWFQASAFTNVGYGPEHNTIACAMVGIDIAAIRYALFTQRAVADIDPSKYPDVIEEHGDDVDSKYLPAINGSGFAYIFNEDSEIAPSTTYVFMATATNTVGDKITKWGSVTTKAAPATTASAMKAAVKNRSGEVLKSLTGKPIANPEKFIYPMPSIPLPENAQPEGDLWTIIHNMQILK